jgi:hypothetical protein
VVRLNLLFTNAGAQDQTTDEQLIQVGITDADIEQSAYNFAGMCLQLTHQKSLTPTNKQSSTKTASK